MSDKNDSKNPSPFSFHDYIDYFAVASVAIVCAGVAAAVVLRRRA
mgnify:FL=1